MFVDRLEELALLRRLDRSRGPQMLVLYGRRRVGKTEVLREFCRRRRSVFFVADQRPAPALLQEFSSLLWQAGGEAPASAPSFPGWDTALAYAGRLAERSRLVLVLDEFPYLAAADRSFPSVLQKAWDAGMRRSRIFLVLCGSSVSFMEGEVLSQRSPLFGRRTSQLFLQPLALPEAALFWGGYSPEDAVRAYAVVGGVPAYAGRLDAREALDENVRRTILDKNAYLYEEVPYLMMQELREPRVYLALMQAIAHGKTAQNEIAQACGMTGSQVAPYLRTLAELRLVERVVPIDERHPHKSRKGSYRLQDPYFRFWLRFVLPNRSLLERGLAGPAWSERIAPRLEEHVSLVFEDLAVEHLWRLAREGRLPFMPARIAPWRAPDAEIEVVAVSGRGDEAILAECKWTRAQVGLSVLRGLRGRSAPAGRALGASRIHLALFSRSGFTPDLRREARREGVLLVTPEDMVRRPNGPRTRRTRRMDRD